MARRDLLDICHSLRAAGLRAWAYIIPTGHGISNIYHLSVLTLARLALYVKDLLNFDCGFK